VIYLSGCTSASYEQAIIGLGCGLMLRPGSYAAERVLPFETFAGDNGCCKVVGGVPCFDPAWTCAKWARMLGAIHDLRNVYDIFDPCRCLFAVVPDWPCNHRSTLKMFAHYAPILRSFRLPLAFAIQDGATVDTVPWSAFDVAFLAGSTSWKCGEEAYSFAIEARNRGKWVHMGRVNSWDRLDWASRIGCDSSDGTFMKHGKPDEMVARLKVWLDNNSPRLTQQGAQA